jgi:hypothetical protein
VTFASAAFAEAVLGRNRAVAPGVPEGSRQIFDNAIYKMMKKRIDPYLEPGEDLLSVTMTEAEGMMHGYLAGGEVGLEIKGALRDHRQPETAAGTPDEGAVKIASTDMTLAITSRRLLIFKFGRGHGANPEYLLTDVPIQDVDSIVVGATRVATRPVTITVRGIPTELEVRRAINTDLLLQAFAQAKSGGTTAVASAGTPAVAPESWQPDPTHRHELRYWDGQTWTSYVADQGVQGTDPVTAS